MSLIDAPPTFVERAARPSRLEPLAVIGIPCCRREIATPTGNHPAHAVVKKYVDAVLDGAGGMPFLIPAEGDADWADAFIARIDGLLIAGLAVQCRAASLRRHAQPAPARCTIRRAMR